MWKTTTHVAWCIILRQFITDNRIIANKPCKVYRWQARNTETGEIIDYGISEGYLQSGPRLFQTIEDAKDFWEYGKRK